MIEITVECPTCGTLFDTRMDIVLFQNTSLGTCPYCAVLVTIQLTTQNSNEVSPGVIYGPTDKVTRHVDKLSLQKAMQTGGLSLVVTPTRCFFVETSTLKLEGAVFEGHRLNTIFIAEILRPGTLTPGSDQERFFAETLVEDSGLPFVASPDGPDIIEFLKACDVWDEALMQERNYQLGQLIYSLNGSSGYDLKSVWVNGYGNPAEPPYRFIAF